MEETDFKIAKAQMVKKCSDAVRDFMMDTGMYDGEMRLFCVRGYTSTPDGRVTEGLTIHISEDFTTEEEAKAVYDEDDEDEED